MKSKVSENEKCRNEQFSLQMLKIILNIYIKKNHHLMTFSTEIGYNFRDKLSAAFTKIPSK